MDALEFVKERKRMCNSFKMCLSCPLSNDHCMIGDTDSEDDDKQIIAAVEKWSKEHPAKTRQSEMLKLFPNTQLNECDVIDICPIRVGGYRGNCAEGGCVECKEKWWKEEIE